MTLRHFLAMLLCCTMGFSSLAAPVENRFFTNRDGLRLHYLEAGHGQNAIVPVSYTHLDVYKRQGIRGDATAKPSNARRSAPANAGN